VLVAAGGMRDDGDMERERSAGTAPIGVVSVGELLIDLIATEAPSLETAERFIRAAGGAPANVAVAVRRLAVPSAFVGAVGDDPFGRFGRSVLEADGVLTDHMVMMDPSRARTTLALVAKNSGGIPDFVFYRGADSLLTPEDIPESLLGRASFLHASSMALMCEPAASATLHAIELAHALGVLISIDPNLRPSSWPSLAIALEAIRPTLDAADVLKVNDEEARLLTGERDLHAALHTLGGSSSRLAVISLGAEGCIWRLGDMSGRASAPAVDVEDTTGAGDAFVGALLAELCRRDVGSRRLEGLTQTDIDSATQFACAAAAVSCTRAGAMPALPTRRQVESLLTTDTDPEPPDTARRPAE
jgi:fructokinase